MSGVKGVTCKPPVAGPEGEIKTSEEAMVIAYSLCAKKAPEDCQAFLTKLAGSGCAVFVPPLIFNIGALKALQTRKGEGVARSLSFIWLSTGQKFLGDVVDIVKLRTTAFSPPKGAGTIKVVFTADLEKDEVYKRAINALIEPSQIARSFEINGTDYYIVT